MLINLCRMSTHLQETPHIKTQSKPRCYKTMRFPFGASSPHGRRISLSPVVVYFSEFVNCQLSKVDFVEVGGRTVLMCVNLCILCSVVHLLCFYSIFPRNQTFGYAVLFFPCFYIVLTPVLHSLGLRFPRCFSRSALYSCSRRSPTPTTTIRPSLGFPHTSRSRSRTPISSGSTVRCTYVYGHHEPFGRCVC